jgi:hypothetical protein
VGKLCKGRHDADNQPAGFFTYISGTQEQDIEFLSSDSDYYQHLYYTNQPGTVNGDVDPQAAKVSGLCRTVVDRVDTWASKNVEIPGADFTYVLLGLKSLFR